MIKYKSILYILVIAAISSCVPAKLLDESKLKLKSCESELSSIKKGAQEVEAKFAELKEQNSKEQKSLSILQKDTTIIGSSLRSLNLKFEKVNALNEKLMTRLNKLISSGEKTMLN